MKLVGFANFEVILKKRVHFVCGKNKKKKQTIFFAYFNKTKSRNLNSNYHK